MLDNPFDPDPADLAFFRKWFGNADFDPLTATAAGLSIAGGALSAGGTLAAGGAAKQAGLMSQAAANFQANQIRTNAGQAIASSQRTMLDTENKTNLAISASRATAAANGVNVGEGSSVTNIGDLAKRGSYLASMDLFNGKSMATGLLNEANGVEYTGDIAALEGKEKQQASYLAAGGTMLGTAGSALSGFAKNNPPSSAPASMPAGYNPSSLGGLY